MTKFKEIIYMCLDLLKERSDDSYYTEEHIKFLALKYRSYLIERKYRKSRNTPFSQMKDENMQTICLPLEKAEVLPSGCSGLWLKSKDKIPQTLNVAEPKTYTVNDGLLSMVTYISVERMPYVGYNKWLKHIIYAAKSSDDYLYLSGSDSQFTYLSSVKMDAVFADPEEALALSCEGDEKPCDIMDADFPLEESLIPSCIEMVVQEIAGPRFAPEDRENNAKDDLAEVGMVSNRQSAPAERSERSMDRRPVQREEE